MGFFQLLPLPLVLCGLELCPAATECLIKAFLFFWGGFDCFFQLSQFRCIIGPFNGLTLLQEVDYEHSLTVPENRGHQFANRCNSLELFERWRPRMFPLFTLRLGFRIKMVNPILILGHKSLEKNWLGQPENDLKVFSKCPIFSDFGLGSTFEEPILRIVCSFPGPSCSKLMTSLVNDSLKFTSSDTQIF